MLAITGATGQLGAFVIQSLLNKTDAHALVAAVRSPEKAADLKAKGVRVRQADYNQPATLATAFEGVDQVLLISSSEVGQRATQHQAVIDAAKAAGVRRVVYTSLLHGDQSPLALADEHKTTEAALKASGLEYVILRNGWYSENYLGNVPTALEHGVLFGATGEGKIASAPRADYAEAAANVLLDKSVASGQVFELAGDSAYTLADFAAWISEFSGKTVTFNNLSEAEYRELLVKAGLPEGFAHILADSDVGASHGALFDDSHTLSTLLGRPTTSMKQSVRDALSQ
jgi:NAD(P)H dehydrogenase (quinone)